MNIGVSFEGTLSFFPRFPAPDWTYSLHAKLAKGLRNVQRGKILQHFDMTSLHLPLSQHRSLPVWAEYLEALAGRRKALLFPYP